MSVSVQFNNVEYLSAREAARRVGYSSDYVARLARQGKITATRIGAQWFVDPESLDSFTQFAERSKEQRREELRSVRLKEREVEGKDVRSDIKISDAPSASFKTPLSVIEPAQFIQPTKVAIRSPWSSHAVALSLTTFGFITAFMFWSPILSERSDIVARTLSEMRVTAFGVYMLATEPWQSESLLSAVSGSDVVGGDSVSADQSPNGIVVVPTSVDQKQIDAIKSSFSDDVHVALNEDGMTGEVTPQFKEGVGDSYRFVLVPVTSAP